MKLQSQWATMLEQARKMGTVPRNPEHKAHKVPDKVINIDLGKKRKRPAKGPDGRNLMMTDLEWAEYQMGKRIRERVVTEQLRYEKPTAEDEATLMPSMVPARNAFDLKRRG